MKYEVIIKYDRKTDTYTAYVPALSGCVSQADTKEDVLKNIRVAIREYLAAVRRLTRRERVITVNV